MKPSVFAAACLVASAAGAAPSSDEQVLIDIENRNSDAYLRGDLNLAGNISAPTGTVDLEVAGSIHQNAGIISAATLKGTSGGKPFDADMRFTDTFVRVNGAWKMVAAQVTPIPK